MKTVHVVRQGEYLSSIAQMYQRRWQTIYYHPDNADFRQRRPDPNVIRPGDQIVIPDRVERVEPRDTDRRHRFRVETVTLRLRIVVRDDAGRAVGNEPYLLTVGDAALRGKTDSRGLLDHRIPVGVTEGKLSLLTKKLTFPLAIGHLDPIEDPDDWALTGVQARLNNLGYFCGAVDDVKGPKTTAAIRRFQEHVLGRTRPDGELDTETRRALKREHGC